MPEPSPTSYAILGLLAARPWSAYELAQHMKTSSNLRQLWPRAESKIYEAPKALEAIGWATSRKERAGGRTRTVYRITPNGRRALRSWLDEPGAPPYFEIEDALKVAYASAGSLEQLRANLRRIRAQQYEQGGALAAGARAILERGFRIPERAHTSALVAGLVRRIGRAVAEWTVWAEEAIEIWDDIEIDEAKQAWAKATYAQMALEIEEILAQHRRGSNS